MIRGLRVALGGLGEHSRRQADIESLFEGRPLADRDAIETAVLPLLEPRGDFRAGADFKRQRLADLVAEALLGAIDIVESES
jgi:CO/xanthine dehydrogenase FAD-binding subunit